jgi:cytochrome c oxidase subunit IV
MLMADLTKMAPGEIHEEHQAESHAPYIKVWGALLVLTLIEYYYAAWFKSFFVILLLGLLFWAVIKAGLVGWFFMHLKFEGNWVYALIVPAFVLATIFVLALVPDMSIKENADESLTDEATSFALPVEQPVFPGLRFARSAALNRSGARSGWLDGDVGCRENVTPASALAPERSPAGFLYFS